jgi:Cu(I)/Ag(I) efflux system membrane fusion protein
MKLVKRTSASAESPSDQVFVARPMQSRIGVVTEAAELIDFSPTVPVTALAIADERRAITSSPKVEGWIRRLGVSVVGQPVHRGDVLYEIYSPELQQRQRDYIDLLTRRDALLDAKRAGGGMSVGNSPPDLMLASVARERYRARARLLAADVSVRVLDDIEKFRRVHDVVPVLAEHEGVVTSIDAREGSYIRPGETVLGYSDPRATWAEVSLNPEVLAHLSAGSVVELHSAVDRSQMISAALEAHVATVDPVTRTARLRVRIPDGMGFFLPGTLLDGRIVMKSHRALTVPVDTVIRTGDGDFVVLAGDADHFSKAAVRLGAEAGDRVEVLEGLSAGQRVVTNGQFLLSAESSFRSSWRRLAADADMPMASPMPGAHDHLAH